MGGGGHNETPCKWPLRSVTEPVWYKPFIIELISTDVWQLGSQEFLVSVLLQILQLSFVKSALQILKSPKFEHLITLEVL